MSPVSGAKQCLGGPCLFAEAVARKWRSAASTSHGPRLSTSYCTQRGGCLIYALDALFLIFIVFLTEEISE